MVEVRPVTRTEWRWALGYALALMALTSLPYLLGVARQAQEWTFSGFVFGVEDGNSYIAKTALGARGAWLFTFTYTSEPQRGALVFPYFLLLGKLARPDAELHAQLVLWFHIARVLSGAGLLLVIYRFVAEFLPDVGARRLALILASLGGGVGWLWVVAGHVNWLGSLPLEFYSPESFTFLELYGLPHLSAARACLLAGLLVYLRALPAWPVFSIRRVASRAWKPGLLLLLAGLIQPLVLLVAFPVLLAHVIVTGLAGLRSGDWRVLRVTSVMACITVLIASPIVIYTALAFRADPLLAQWTAQNLIPSPHPWHYVIAYGLWLPAAALGLRWLSVQGGRPAFPQIAGTAVPGHDGPAGRPEAARLFLGWVVILPVLLYSPFNLQRRLSEGFFVLLVTLAVAGIWYAVPTWPERARRLASAAMLALCVPASFLLLVGGLNVAAKPAEPAFIPRDQRDAFAFLEAEGEPGAVVLSSHPVGNALPAYTAQVAYLGHGPETLFYEAKQAAVRAFFQADTPDEERRQTLQAGRVRYVLVGPHEAALGDFDPSAAAYLREIYTAGAYRVYEVV